MSEQKLRVDPVQDRKNSSHFDASVEFRTQIIDPILDSELDNKNIRQTQKEFFEKGIEQLRLEGCPEKEISKTLRRTYEERKYERMKNIMPSIRSEECKLQNPSWFYRTMQQNGVTDPDYAHNAKSAELEPEPENFELENIKWLKQIGMIEQFCRKFREILKNNSFDIMIPEDEKKETLLVFNALLKDSLESINNKTKIQKYHQYLLYETYMVLNMNDLASKYSSRFKEMQTVTAKQIRKILAGRCTSLLDIFNPKTTYESTRLGFSGIVCDHCKCLRTVYDNVTTNGRKTIKAYCYACHNHSAVPKTRMPKPNMLADAWRDPHG